MKLPFFRIYIFNTPIIYATKPYTGGITPRAKKDIPLPSRKKVRAYFNRARGNNTTANNKTMPEEELKWKVIESAYIFKAPWLTVREESVKLPNGSLIPSYYVLEYPNWVNVIAITKDGSFILVKQYRHGSKSVNYELCAGVCDESDESPLFSAQRELLEETGYGNGMWEEYMIISPNPSTHTNMTYCYLAKDVEKLQEQELEETECLSVHLLSREEVKELLDKNGIVQALMAAPLWKYFCNRD